MPPCVTMHASGSPALGAQEAGEAVPIYHPPGNLGKAPVSDTGRQCSLSAQDALPGWHNPYRVRTDGFSVETGGTGTEAESKSHTIPRGLCCQQPLSFGGNTSQERQAITPIRQNTSGKASGDELGTAIEASVQHRCRYLPALWRQGESAGMY